MKTKNQMSSILKKVAEKDGVSVEHVRTEIKKAIDIGMSSTDPHVRAFWMSVPCKGTRPTPEEVLLFMSTHIEQEFH